MAAEINQQFKTLLKRGSKKAYKLIYDHYGDEIFRYIMRYFPGDYHQAEDVFQDVFVTCMDKVDNLKDIENIRAWLYRVASNRCIDLKRKTKKRGKDIQLDEQIASSGDKNASLDSDLSRSHLGQAIEKAVNKLPTIQKQVFIMREYQGLKYQDISEVLGLSLSITKKAMTVAVLQLQTSLEKMQINRSFLN